MSGNNFGRPSKVVRYRGADITVSELAKLAGCKRHTMHKRLRTQTPEQAVAAGAIHPRSQPGLHAYKDQMLTLRQLAALAGCTLKTIKARIARTKSVEKAVELGEPDLTRPRPYQRKEKKPKAPPKQRGRQYAYKGQMLRVRELAALAGCSPDTMGCRLREGASVERAVEMGRADPGRVRERNKIPKPPKPPQPKAVKSPKLRQKTWDAAIVAKDKRKGLEGPTIIPAGLVPQVAERHPDRFAVELPKGYRSMLSASECRPWARAATA